MPSVYILACPWSRKSGSTRNRDALTSGKDYASWQPSHSPWLIAIAVMLATFMEVIDTSIASVAVPYIAGSVSSTNNQAEWVLTVYLIANAVFLPSSNWFSEKFGRKRF